MIMILWNNQRYGAAVELCDQTVRLFFQYLAITMKSCPIVWIFVKVGLKFRPTYLPTHLCKNKKNCPKTALIVPNWTNFTKSGHTGQRWLKPHSHCPFYAVSYWVSGKQWWMFIHVKKRTSVSSIHTQCDQIGRFFALWATFSSLWQQLICPNLSHS